jgi:hypothetical protein
MFLVKQANITRFSIFFFHRETWESARLGNLGTWELQNPAQACSNELPFSTPGTV